MRSVLQVKATVLDVALPHSFSPGAQPRRDIRTFFAERMTMPERWDRGLWGRVYHMVSGYGYNTVLACLVEPVVMAAYGRNKPYAQGRTLDTDDVLDFGQSHLDEFSSDTIVRFLVWSSLRIHRNSRITILLSQD